MKRTAIIFLLLSSLIGGIIWYGQSIPVKKHLIVSKTFTHDANEIWRLLINYDKYPEWRENVYAVQKIPSNNEFDAWKEVDEDGNTIPYRFTGYEPGMFITLEAMGKNFKTQGKWHFEVSNSEDNKSATLTITEDTEIPELLPRVIDHLLISNTYIIDKYFRSIDNKFIGDDRRATKKAESSEQMPTE